MFEKADKKLVAAIAPISMAVAMSFGSVTASAGTYVTDSAGTMVTNGYKECWAAVGGMKKMVATCGDAMPATMKKEKDSDGDGVADSIDRCPNTPAGVKVTAFGCPKDSDGDGVPDYKDNCPNTKAGAKVDAHGCEIIGSVVINTTTDHFDFDSAVLKPAMKAELDMVASKVKASAGDEQLEVVGHTDSTGPAAYNQKLSERRAQAAASYLADMGLQNLSVRGAGENSPVADNGTREGRAQNRRVEINTK